MDHGQRVRAELKARRKPGAVVARLGGLRGLASLITGRGVPPQIRAFLEEEQAANSYAACVLVGQKRGEIGELFKDHSEADWKRVIETLVPHLAPSAQCTWRILARRPYQDGLTRKPFRCPRSRVALADVRGRWLLSTTLLLGEYDADIRWVAERASALAGWSGPAEIGWLLAGAIDMGGETGDAVYEILGGVLSGDRESDQMGRHVTQALMSCARPDAWERVERLLLSAQRQEGLRQTILESVDEAHPDAFRRMLRLIRGENLSRFSSVVRAADTWFGFQWDGASAFKIDGIIERVLLFLDDPAARAAALEESDAETVYLALWSIAFEDVDAAIEPATRLLASPTAEIRFVATHMMVQTLWDSTLRPLVDVLGDASLPVAARALDVFSGVDVTPLVDGKQLFDRLEHLMQRLPKRSQTVEALVWPWWKRKLEKKRIAAAMAANAKAVPGERMLPYVPELDPSQRQAYVRLTAELAPRWSPQKGKKKARVLSENERTMVLGLLGDASAEARAAAFEAMREQPLRGDEIDRLVDLLGRKPGDLRNGCIARLRTLPDAALLATADRLLADGSDLRRLAGLELLRDAAEAKRAVGDVRSRVKRYADDHESLTDEERAHVAAVLGDRGETATTEDALGLIDPSSVRTWPAPRARPMDLDTPGARASLAALADLVLAHQQVEIRTASGETKLLIEAAGWGFGPRKVERPGEREIVVPLADVWRGWLERRPAEARDGDGLEMLRALMTNADEGAWKSAPVQKVVALGEYSAGSRFLRGLVEWCIAWDPPSPGADFLLDGLETSLAELTKSDYDKLAEDERSQARFVLTLTGFKPAPHQLKLASADPWLKRLRWWRSLFPSSIDGARAERLYGLLRGFQVRSGGFDGLRITLDDFLAAHRAGVTGETEFLDLLVGRWSHRQHASLLREVSSRKPPRGLAEHPELIALVDRCRRRVVEVETGRGDRTTAASALAMELRATGGLETLSRAVGALGKSHLSRRTGWLATEASRQDTLSHLVLRSAPRAEDTPDAFARWAREARIREARLLEVAVYAPQWAGHVNRVLEWPGLEDGVWWIHAHTKDDRSWQLAELKEIWAAEVSERTPLSASDLTEGAVDVGWFERAYGALGPERWEMLDAAAKYAAGGAGHARARLFARAMAGLVTRAEILERIDGSRHQDSVRALGLLPLADGKKRREDLLERYQRLQRFRREARKFGSQRQQSETRAVAIGMANLARTAGFRDPQRLQWAMEQEAVADLARGPIRVTKGDVTLQLSVDGDGQPSLTTTKNGKALKSVPAALKKDPDVADLKDRLQELRRQRSRVRDALEEAMCRGDRFAGAELRALLDHPILAPALSRLVFVGDGAAGYLDGGGRVLRDHAGAHHAVGNDETIRIAHPDDLLRRGDWSAWQRECFRAERIQPFKQLFRELYPITDSERGMSGTRRYAGHQVNPGQALALLGGRGWVTHPEEGVSRTFHEDGLTARLAFQEPFHTPAEIEGLTLEGVVFTRKGEWTEVPLDLVPARLFSETMRDIDLVVSVAHRGGVDPEATASTVEMRAGLIRETCELLALGNVELTATHAVVRGELGTYSIHLGSAGVTLMPGTALPVVAVHSQHRGRLFLPFADDDPRTAEVLSKVLLFARDRQIKDPSILEWIRAAQGGQAT